ncbi:unnamed protein product [Colletotrichum noveboracense]|uniref:Uncharacterized protein n=1 Tax=Colletotrichum noveboracense TaxID=2664923 RepID=A0A9W4S705_9PEZI|nr:unnamed protein product [Colletotrichum noveboracense]
MHPISSEVTKLPRLAADGRRRREQAGEKSGMSTTQAQKLAAYITGVFRSAELLSEGTARPPKLAPTTETPSSGSISQPFIPTTTLYHLPHKRHYSHNDNNKEEDNRDSRGRGSKDKTQHGIEGLFIDNESNSSQPADSTANNKTNAASYSQILRESNRLQKLMQELHSCFRLKNITAVSYALTIYINSKLEARPQYLLINCNIIAREYLSSCNFTFYPQAFHPVYRNISSSQPPVFLNLLFAAIKGNMSDWNEGANVLSFSYFQSYSNTKRSMRHSLNNLLATKGYATAALMVLTLDVYATAASRDKREQLLRIICSQGTPESLEKLRPFARKRLQIEVAINSSKVAY